MLTHTHSRLSRRRRPQRHSELLPRAGQMPVVLLIDRRVVLAADVKVQRQRQQGWPPAAPNREREKGEINNPRSNSRCEGGARSVQDGHPVGVISVAEAEWSHDAHSCHFPSRSRSCTPVPKSAVPGAQWRGGPQLVRLQGQALAWPKGRQCMLFLQKQRRGQGLQQVFWRSEIAAQNRIRASRTTTEGSSPRGKRGQGSRCIIQRSCQGVTIVGDSRATLASAAVGASNHLNTRAARLRFALGSVSSLGLFSRLPGFSLRPLAAICISEASSVT